MPQDKPPRAFAPTMPADFEQMQRAGGHIHLAPTPTPAPARSTIPTMAPPPVKQATPEPPPQRAPSRSASPRSDASAVLGPSSRLDYPAQPPAAPLVTPMAASPGVSRPPAPAMRGKVLGPAPSRAAKAAPRGFFARLLARLRPGQPAAAAGASGKASAAAPGAPAGHDATRLISAKELIEQALREVLVQCGLPGDAFTTMVFPVDQSRQSYAVMIAMRQHVPAEWPLLPQLGDHLRRVIYTRLGLDVLSVYWALAAGVKPLGPAPDPKSWRGRLAALRLGEAR